MASTKTECKLLQNCHKAMLPNGKVLLAETLGPPGDEPNQIKGIDVAMLAVTGGLERRQAPVCKLVRRRWSTA
jgi:hypothetical protein